MQLRRVTRLEVLNLQHSKNKHPPKTFVSLRLDGEAVPEVAIKGEVQPLSGSNTVAAFESGEKPALLAWIDPESGQCFHVWRHSLAQSTAALLAGIFCFYLFPDWDKFALWQQITFSIPLVGGAAWFLLAPGIQQRQVENAMQKMSKELYGTKDKLKKSATD
jgi:hypothetical protein